MPLQSPKTNHTRLNRLLSTWTCRRLEHPQTPPSSPSPSQAVSLDPVAQYLDTVTPNVEVKEMSSLASQHFDIYLSDVPNTCNQIHDDLYTHSPIARINDAHAGKLNIYAAALESNVSVPLHSMRSFLSIIKSRELQNICAVKAAVALGLFFKRISHDLDLWKQRHQMLLDCNSPLDVSPSLMCLASMMSCCSPPSRV
eukprot:CAMPEP_0176438154 /NCGR_PEP_ID=MMETSP0127-20121128/19105_1 /TAXON_ID=938130 /ORGANISM="Platyophrya macrostoma, Strain WH" /LENGTH=197 /DNA_ID=CAMNT_0017822031 /DNA_START=206 /DNA_END=800 /DNA_ORIENTATION=-